MKHLFYLASLALALAACGGKENEQTQDYTSFVIIQKSDVLLPNLVSGYFDSIGYCHKVAEHGDLSLGQMTTETVVLVDVDSIYLFTDYMSILRCDAGKFTNPFFLHKNKKNIFELNDDSRGEQVDKCDSLQYPY
jgi:hypothetical protein